MNQVIHRQIKCPQCGKKTVFAPENPFRPFCSERCRLIDLGAWASGDYKVPVQEQEYIEMTESDEGANSSSKSNSDSN